MIEGIKTDKSGVTSDAAFISLFILNHSYSLIIFQLEWRGGGLGALDSKTR